MRNHTLWSMVHQAWEAILPTYEPVFERYCAEAALDPATFSLLLAALTFQPEPVTVKKLQVCGPYTADASYEQQLQLATTKGYLGQVRPDAYALTDSGERWLEVILEAGRAAMAAADPLPASEGQRLATMFDWLVEASMEAPSPPENWSICLAYRLMPAPMPPLPYIEQAISCLNAYRDDAHLAAWRPSGLDAPAMEALTLLWNGQANSLETLEVQLKHRGHRPAVYEAAVDELRARDLVHGSDSALRLTPAGYEFRDGIEQQTDDYFFAPWVCLSDAEGTVMLELLTDLRDNLHAMVFRPDYQPMPA